MGMYDSLRIKNVICNNCGKENDEFEFQTKDLYNCLDSFGFPHLFVNYTGPSWDKIEYSKEDDEESVIKCGDMEITIYGSCQHCQKFQGGVGFIKDYILCGYDLSSDKFESKRNIEIFPELKEILEKSQQRKIDLRDMKSALEGLVFAIMNGEQVSDEDASLIDSMMKLDMATNSSLGLLQPTSMSLHGYAQIIYELVSKKKSNG